MVGRGAISPRPDRRAFLTAAGILLAAGLPLRAGVGPRLAAIDWAMLETATALGHMPVAAAELIRFRADVGVPAIPDTVTDLGLRGAPNFELLQLVRPTLILSSPYYTRYQARMEAIAPVLSLPGAGRCASGPAGRAGRGPCRPAVGAGRYRRCAPPARLRL